ncbi:TetR/AcrR family transcriptional regulator [Corallococcus sp. H22C18031201]|nr:TetR/AcrR family transcriptional regulator [Corallococcus sp. H22C18031201]
MGAVRRDGLERRDALLDAALRCFVKQGVLGTGIEDIRKAAGASPSSVYHHFDGMPGITLALLVRTFERLVAHLSTRVVGTPSARAAVEGLVDGHLEWVLSHRDEARFMYQAMSLELGARVAEPLQVKKAELLAPIVQHLTPFIATGKLPPWPPPMLDVVLLGPSHEACRRFLGGADLSPEWMRGELPRLAWRAIAPRRERAMPPKRPRRKAPR